MLINYVADAYSRQLARTLNGYNFNYLVLADRSPDQIPSDGLRYRQLLSYEALPAWIDEHQPELEFLFLLSADDDALFRMLWRRGVRYQLPLVFRATRSRTEWITRRTEQPFFWAGLAWTKPAGADYAPVPDFQRLVLGQATISPSSEDYVAVSPATVAAATYYLVHHRSEAGIYALNNPRTYRTKGE